MMLHVLFDLRVFLFAAALVCSVFEVVATKIRLQIFF